MEVVGHLVAVPNETSLVANRDGIWQGFIKALSWWCPLINASLTGGKLIKQQSCFSSIYWWFNMTVLTEPKHRTSSPSEIRDPCRPWLDTRMLQSDENISPEYVSVTSTTSLRIFFVILQHVTMKQTTFVRLILLSTNPDTINITILHVSTVCRSSKG